MLTTLTFKDIADVDMINSVDLDKVSELAKSIRDNGWVGAPILVHTGINQLVTGSHRLAALALLAADDDAIYDMTVAVDVSDIVDAALARENMSYPMIDYSDIGWLFVGTDIEQYQSHICEW